MMKLKDDRWCFACGSENPGGLHLSDFHFEDDSYICTFTPRRQHQGWVGVTHGGIVATLLDEIMTRMLGARQANAATAELQIRYHQPLPIGQKVIIRGWIADTRRRLFHTRAELRLPDDTLIASAQAKFLAPSE